MGLYDFSIKLADKDAGAQVLDVNASYKDLSQVCRAIKRKPVAAAREILEQAIARKRVIPYKKFAKHLGHRSELLGKRGRYPVKECRVALRLLNDAVANARQKALDTEALVVKHAAAYKQRVYLRHRKYWVGGSVIGYGKQAVWSRYVTCRAELVVSEAGRKEKPSPEPAGKSAAAEAQTKKARQAEAGETSAGEAPARETPEAAAQATLLREPLREPQ